ncbi:hypothetical protein BN1221_02545c [Brenneria goodwinii]|uniref:Uncharacterized protein n=1 Tax=Brenneria goodwinii TaxID=1109412 RepID=A0A0G4JVY8_9GAMM|nr:hypothetical protein BN1221_02545c [Brenneria goodwinii]
MKGIVDIARTGNDFYITNFLSLTTTPLISQSNPSNCKISIIQP